MLKGGWRQKDEGFRFMQWFSCHFFQYSETNVFPLRQLKFFEPKNGALNVKLGIKKRLCLQDIISYLSLTPGNPLKI